MHRRIPEFSPDHPTPEEIAAGVARGRLLHARAVREGFGKVFAFLRAVPRRETATAAKATGSATAVSQRA